jgi:hypothetical protein
VSRRLRHLKGGKSEGLTATAAVAARAKVPKPAPKRPAEGPKSSKRDDRLATEFATISPEATRCAVLPSPAWVLRSMEKEKIMQIRIHAHVKESNGDMVAK